MAFEKEKDKVIEEKEIKLEGGNSIVVGVYCYNNGTPKYGESRRYTNADGTVRFSAIGRKTQAEMKLILPAMQEMYKKLEELGTATG